MPITKLQLNGTKMQVALATEDETMELQASFLVGDAARGAGTLHEISLAQGEVLELKFQDDTTWLCNADSLEDIFPQSVAPRRGPNDFFLLPAGVQNDDTDRGVVGDILLKVVNVFAKKKISKSISELAADLERKHLENRSGLYTLDRNFDMQPYKAGTIKMPLLIFLHGTNSSTQGSFAEMMFTPVWEYIYSNYDGRVLAFEHETLTKSPLQNVLDLLKQLPSLATVHLVSHSRGGLVGDVLARFCNSNESSRGFDENEVNYLQKENRKSDLATIQAIRKELDGKKIVIEKFVRVACPASGTTLASGRMDNFFNVTLNLVGLTAGIIASPVYLSLRALATAVINSKNDPDTLPGLEAMNPDSPFIKVLNSPQSSIVLDSPLAIISGNCKMKLSLRALIIIASRLFFTKNNDLVVNTAAMYQGAQRSTQVQYFFNESADTDHFHYFKNAVTQKALMSALKTSADNSIPDFQLLQKGAAMLDRNAVLKLDGGQVFYNTVTGTRPIVIVLPGIMGSNIKANDKLVWINYFRFLAGDLLKLDISAGNVQAPSLVKTSYESLVKHLLQNYDVITFAFDWRKSLDEAAAIFKDKIEALLSYRQPIKIVGHSMGGVLVRDFMVTQRATWEKLNASAGFRLIFLGSPLGGSYRIPFVLMGNDGIIDKISKLDIFHTKKELLGMFSKFPGLLSLLPFSTDADRDFGAQKTWTDLLQAQGTANWPGPTATDISNFASYRNKALAGLKATDFTNAVYIAGKDKATPAGYRIDDTAHGKEVVYLSTAEGDQSVTWDTGIPRQMVQNDTVYYVNVSHGALSNDPGLFRGIDDILTTGATTQFSKTRPAVRGTEKLFKSPPVFDHDLSPEGVEKTILAIGDAKAEAVTRKPLEVRIINGDLRYASFPLLSGHFDGDGITSAEAQVDKHLNYTLSDRNRMGIYPGDIGSSEIFIPDAGLFKGAIIVGLGALNEFTAYQLTQTVQQAVCKYLLSQHKTAAQAGISSLIIGSGYGGLTIDNALRALIQGVQNANEKICKLREGACAGIDRLEFVELFEDAALSCYYSLRKISIEDGHALNISIKERIVTVPGSRKRILMLAGESWWNRITVKLKDGAKYEPQRTTFAFSASTGAARDIERDLQLSPNILQELLEEISTQDQWTKAVAKTIFELLIPNDFKEQLKRRSNASWIVDQYTAAYPWELLQDSVSDSRPLCVNAGMIRQLALKESSTMISTVAANNALVVGDPFLDGFIQQLPGANKEAVMLAEKLRNFNFNTAASLNESAGSVIKKLFSEDYKIIHLAGHGVFNADDPSRSGMVIGKDIFLTTAEIAQMSSIPEFVFVNCCYLGHTEGYAEELYRNRYKLAASIGVQLISNGVKAVVVAGWAVNDVAALSFAERFYDEMLQGNCFGDAVQQARACCFENHSEQNTWGAYQCYGDPFYKFNLRQAGKSSGFSYVVPEQAVIDLNNLLSEMHMESMKDDAALNRLKAISQQVEKDGIRDAAITEREAFVLAQLCQYQAALTRFDELFKMEQANFYVSTLEVFCDTKARKAIHGYEAGELKIKEAAAQMDQVIAELQNLMYISGTAERHQLLASANLRRTLLASTMDQTAKYLGLAADFYQKAFSISGKEETENSLTNWYICEAILILMEKRIWGAKHLAQGNGYTSPSLKDVSRHIIVLEEQYANAPQKGYLEYRLRLYSDLIEMLLHPKKSTKAAAESLLKSFVLAWQSVESIARKNGDIAQLNVLIHLLAGIKKPELEKLARNLEEVRNALQNMLSQK